MLNDTTKRLELLLGSVDAIIQLLSLETCSEEDQMKVIERFSDILFKRILLHVPRENIEEVNTALIAGDEDECGEQFLDTVRRVIPNFDSCIQEEIKKTLADFRQ